MTVANLRYVNVTADDFIDLLSPMGYSVVKPDGVKELTFGRAVGTPSLRLTLRVYTSVVQGNGRKKGGDAIRAALFGLVDGKPIFLRGTKRSHRIPTWRDNLLRKIRVLEDLAAKMVAAGTPFLDNVTCPQCNAQMVRRESKHGEFFGCRRYPTCRGLRAVHDEI